MILWIVKKIDLTAIVLIFLSGFLSTLPLQLWTGDP